MAVKKGEEEIITGGGDSKINFWKDYTMLEEQEKVQHNQERVLTLVKIILLLTFVGNKNYPIH
jgi:hypothetical protein